MVTHLMGADLNNIVKTQKLSDDHVQFLVYQILRGLKYIHSAGIIHRVSRDHELSSLQITMNLSILFWITIGFEAFQHCSQWRLWAQNIRFRFSSTNRNRDDWLRCDTMVYTLYQIIAFLKNNCNIYAYLIFHLGIELQRSCWTGCVILKQLIFGPLGASWPSYLLQEHFFRELTVSFFF